MKRISTAWYMGVCLCCACNGSSAGRGKDSGPAFPVDTAQIKQMDSLVAARRRSDSILVQRANNTPGINAGAGHYSIDVPKGWRRADTLMGNIRALILDTLSPISNFRTNLSIVSDSMRGMSVDDYESGTLNSLVQYVPQFSLIGKGERRFGGRSSRWLHYSQDREGTKLENICYIIPDKGIAYILTCSALKGRLLASRPAFEQAVTSFRVRDP